MGLPIKSLRFTPCAARQTKLSSGCKSRLMITTAGMLGLSVDPLLRGLRGDSALQGHARKSGFASFVMNIGWIYGLLATHPRF